MLGGLGSITGISRLYQHSRARVLATLGDPLYATQQRAVEGRLWRRRCGGRAMEGAACMKGCGGACGGGACTVEAPSAQPAPAHARFDAPAALAAVALEPKTGCEEGVNRV